MLFSSILCVLIGIGIIVWLFREKRKQDARYEEFAKMLRIYAKKVIKCESIIYNTPPPLLYDKWNHEADLIPRMYRDKKNWVESRKKIVRWIRIGFKWMTLLFAVIWSNAMIVAWGESITIQTYDIILKIFLMCVVVIWHVYLIRIITVHILSSIDSI